MKIKIEDIEIDISIDEIYQLGTIRLGMFERAFRYILQVVKQFRR